MRITTVALFLCLAAGRMPAAEVALVFPLEFEGRTPPGFRSTLAGEGPAGDWRVVLEPAPPPFGPLSPKASESFKRPVLAQLSRDSTDNRFPLLIYEKDSFDDFTLETRFKIVEGQTEQMAGIAFRIQDEKNFYYIRASALGTNLSFARFVNGQLGERIASRAEIPRGIWQDLRIECRGSEIRGYLNGNELLLVTVTAGVGHFSNGKIGFWTKSDSVSYFADTRITYQPREILAQTIVRNVMYKYPRLLGLKIYAATNQLAAPTVVGSTDPAEIGQPGQPVLAEVISKGTAYYGKDKEKGAVILTLPLRDKNGEPMAAVKVSMKSFPGQTENNALARAQPIVKYMEHQALTLKDLLQ